MAAAIPIEKELVTKIEEIDVKDEMDLRILLALKKLFPEHIAYTGKYTLSDDRTKYLVEYIFYPDIRLDKSNVNLKILYTIAKILEIMSNNNIVHGDFQEHNIIIYENRPIIIDWLETINLVDPTNYNGIFEKFIDIADFNRQLDTFDIPTLEENTNILEEIKSIEPLYLKKPEFLPKFIEILKKYDLNTLDKINTFIKTLLNNNFIYIQNEAKKKYIKYKNKYLKLRSMIKS